MGFTFILLLACLALTGLAVIAFRSGARPWAAERWPLWPSAQPCWDTCGSRLPCDGGDLWKSDSLPMRRKNRP